MENFIATALLLTGVVVPIVLFWVLRSRLNGLAAAAVAVATGWALNVAWALASRGTSATDPTQVNGDTLSMAMRFGWACPTVLVVLTWLAWRFKTRRERKL